MVEHMIFGINIDNIILWSEKKWFDKLTTGSPVVWYTKCQPIYEKL